MNITLTINAETPAELREAISGLAVFGGVSATTNVPSVPTITEVEKPKRNRTAPKTDEVTKPDQVEDKTPEEEDKSDAENNADANDTDTGGSEEIPTVEELRALAAEVAQSGKQPGVKALLVEFQVGSISKVPEEQRTEFYSRLKAL